jgi:hypothetical protein
MRKEIPDYLHLYLGCRCITVTKKTGRFSGLDYCQDDNSTMMITVRYSDDIGDWFILNNVNKICRITLILKPVEEVKNLSPEQCKQLVYTFGQPGANSFIQSLLANDEFATAGHPFHKVNAAANQLRKWGFDCDGLINAGLAINALEFDERNIEELVNWRVFLLKYKNGFQ